MISDFYFRFYKMTGSEKISILLSYCARFLFFLRFLMKKLVTKKRIVKMDSSTAIDLIQQTSPKPETKPDYVFQYDSPCYDLSIIVPVYNHIDVLSDCIDSILNQKTRYSYELILIDDGSTDGAQDLIEKYRENPIVRIHHQPNGGIAAARNAGIDRVRGMYLMFVDCDDTVHDSIVEELMSAAIHNNRDIVMGAHNLVKLSNGHTAGVLPNIYPKWNLNGYKNNDEIMNYAGLPWAKVYKRELFRGVRFFPGYWYEDTIIHGLLFTQCNSFEYIPSVVYDYYWTDQNFSHTQNSKKTTNVKTADRYWLILAITERYKELGLPLDARFYTMLLEHVSAYYYKTIASMPDGFIEAMFVAARDLLLKYKPKEKVKLPYMLRLTEKAMIQGNIALWKLCSLNQ